MGADGGDDGIVIAGQAGDESGAVDAVAVEFTGPQLGKFLGLGRRELPLELRLHGFERQPGLLRGQEFKEVVREKMYVRIGDQQRSPGGLAGDPDR